MAEVQHTLSDREMKFAMTIDALNRNPEQIAANYKIMAELIGDADKDTRAAFQTQRSKYDAMHADKAIGNYNQALRDWQNQVGSTGSQAVGIAAEGYYDALREHRRPIAPTMATMNKYPDVKKATERFVSAEANPDFLKAEQIRRNTFSAAQDSINFRSRYAEVLCNNGYSGLGLQYIVGGKEIERLIKEAR